MDIISNAVALLLCLFGSIAFYLGCPNQQWFSQAKLSFAQGLTLCAALLGLAIWMFARQFFWLSAVFAVVTTVMLLLGALPFFSQFSTPVANQRKVASSLVKSELASRYRGHWALRPILALVLGFPLAVGLSGLIALLSPGPLTDDVKSQFTMWLITPLWLTPLSLIFFSHRLLPWVLGFLSLNGLVFGLLWVLAPGLGAK